MKIYLDSDDFHYLEVNNNNKNKDDKNKYELSKEPVRARPKRDRGGIASLLCSLSMLGIVTGFTVYTITQIMFSR